MTEDSLLPFDLPAVQRKKVTAAFDGGRLSSDGGVLLLKEIERRLNIVGRLAGCIRDRRDPSRIEHTIEEMLRLRIFAIAAGYEDADDCDALRQDAAFKMAVGRLPESGRPLCSQPTMSRLENGPSRIETARMMMTMVDLFCDSFPRPPKAITLDIDDTEDEVHGQQQMSLFNAHYDCHCFLPIHVYEATTGRPVTVILRQGSTPTGAEVRTVLRHIVRRIRRHWPKVRSTVRGDSHYGRPEAMAPRPWRGAKRTASTSSLVSPATRFWRLSSVNPQRRCVSSGLWTRPMRCVPTSNSPTPPGHGRAGAR
jgi:hypothetical protein